MKISIIVAMSEDRVIGRENQMPWHVPGDLPRFKKITMGHPVIMGRKTFESIGKVLPGRDNLVITRQASLAVPGAIVVNSLEAALAWCERRLAEGAVWAGEGARAGAGDEVFIIGGGEIFTQAMPRVERIYLTIVHAKTEGDAWFPSFDPAEFREVRREEGMGQPRSTFMILDRR